jgi:alpha/beta superfamily hydrolase
VSIAGEVPRALRTVDGLVLEGKARLPATTSRAVVLCHPHPLYGGSMDNAIIVVIARAIRDSAGDEVGTIRFNFRGVQGSEGNYDEGRGEVLDALSAVDAVRRDLPDARISLLGYSFGSWVALRAAFEHEAVERVGLVAPAARMFEYPQQGASRALPIEIVVGDHDEFVHIDDARVLAHRLGASLTVLSGADHAFVRRRREVADAMVPFLIGRAHESRSPLRDR